MRTAFANFIMSFLYAYLRYISYSNFNKIEERKWKQDILLTFPGSEVRASSSPNMNICFMNMDTAYVKYSSWTIFHGKGKLFDGSLTYENPNIRKYLRFRRVAVENQYFNQYFIFYDLTRSLSIYLVCIIQVLELELNLFVYIQNVQGQITTKGVDVISWKVHVNSRMALHMVINLIYDIEYNEKPKMSRLQDIPLREIHQHFTCNFQNMSFINGEAVIVHRIVRKTIGCYVFFLVCIKFCLKRTSWC